MYLKSFAKINVYLDVLSKRDDGYHEMEMIILPLELHDSIEIEHLPFLQDSYVTCDHIDMIDPKYNLINTTISKLREEYHFTQNYNIHVHKEIPIQAGLGGGSSNAAVIINSFNRFLSLNMSEQKKIDIAKSIGADVPFCLFGKPAIVQGIGEKLTFIRPKHQYNVLIIKPSTGLSTKQVFNVSDTMTLKHGNIEDVKKALLEGDDELLANSMFNALEDASMSLTSEIQETKTLLFNEGFKMVLMSGSGSCVYALTRDNGKAKSVAKKLAKLGYEVYLTKTFK